MKYIVKFKVGGIVFTRDCEHEYDLFKSVEAIVNEDITRIDKEIWLAFLSVLLFRILLMEKHFRILLII